MSPKPSASNVAHGVWMTTVHSEGDSYSEAEGLESQIPTDKTDAARLAAELLEHKKIITEAETVKSER